MLDVPGAQHSFNGRDELMQAVVGARSQGGSLSVEFPDIKVNVAPDKRSAIVYLTARGKVSGQKDSYLQELQDAHDQNQARLAHRPGGDGEDAFIVGGPRQSCCLVSA